MEWHVILTIYFVHTDKSEEKIIGLDDKLVVENGKQCLSNPVTPSVEYKFPLVWIDLEMTGRRMLFSCRKYTCM